MLRITNGNIKLEYDGELNNETRKLIENITNSIFSSIGVPENILKKDEKKNNAVPEKDSEIINLSDNNNISESRKKGFAKTFSSLACKCGQHFIMENTKTHSIIFKNYNDNKLYDLGPIKLPKISTLEVEEKIAVYKDCLELSKQATEIKLLSDDYTNLLCPVCNKTLSINEMFEYIRLYDTDNECFICGEEREQSINQIDKDKQSLTCDCKNKCLEKLSKK